MTKQIDPVCGMQIDEKQAAAKSEYDGQTYYFCSTSCKDKFDQDPGRFFSDAVADVVENYLR